MIITQILDHWQTSTPAKLLRGAPDFEVLALAAHAVILLGYRAKQCDRDDLEHACRKFLAILHQECDGIPVGSYCMQLRRLDPEVH